MYVMCVSGVCVCVCLGVWCYDGVSRHILVCTFTYVRDHLVVLPNFRNLCSNETPTCRAGRGFLYKLQVRTVI